MSIIPPEHEKLLSLPVFAHIATVGAQGEPQSSPVWIDWDGTYIKFGHTKKGNKYHNVQRNPLIALSLLDPANPYHYLEIRGKVARIEDDRDDHFVDSMAKKYMGLDEYPDKQPNEERVVIYIEPEKTTAMG